MKLVHEPKVYLAAQIQTNDEEIDRFLTDEGVTWQTDTEVGAAKVVETAGRICYMSFAKPRPGGNKAYIDNILGVGHGSVVEHAVFALIITGVSRSLSHELVRHRVGISPSQLSQRYVDESVAEFVVPPDLSLEVECYLFGKEAGFGGDFVQHDKIKRATELYPAAASARERDKDRFSLMYDAGRMWYQSVNQSHRAYVWLSGYMSLKAEGERPDLGKTDARKFARQSARSVLPNATETKLYLTGNARAWRHLVELRASRHADPEIRVLAHKAWKVLKEAAPVLFGDYQEVALPDGTVELTTPYRKV